MVVIFDYIHAGSIVTKSTFLRVDSIRLRPIDGIRPLPSEEAKMSKPHRVKYVHEGRYVAEVDIELLEDETEWSPYLSVGDAYKREALRRGDSVIY